MSTKGKGPAKTKKQPTYEILVDGKRIGSISGELVKKEKSRLRGISGIEFREVE